MAWVLGLLRNRKSTFESYLTGEAIELQVSDLLEGNKGPFSTVMKSSTESSARRKGAIVIMKTSCLRTYIWKMVYCPEHSFQGGASL